MKKSIITAIYLLCLTTGWCQSPTAFVKAGNGPESGQEFFPGAIRSRPALGDYAHNGKMGLYSGGQDLGEDAKKWYVDERWGDQGDGTYANPILNADYSDPDVIRVGNKYYMTCSEFHFMGMPILESTDLVNWQIIARVHDNIPLAGYDDMTKYGEGTWAPALRYHDGKFWIYVCMPNDGLFVTTATDPAGPWSPLTCIKKISGWEDPCPFWDEDGQAYLGHSQLGGGPIIIHKMTADGMSLLDDGVKVYEGPTSEGTKIFKRNNYYYISIPEGGVGTGWQMFLRSKNIYGPYEGKKILEQGVTNINGPHQGALVDTPEGNWWFYHFQSAEPLGRVVHLQPVSWTGDYPIIGIDYDGNGIGEPVKICKKPYSESKASKPQTNDNFNSAKLSPWWQWNHNPSPELWSLESNPGYLALRPAIATKIRDARGMFTQKVMGYKSTATAELVLKNLSGSQRTGISSIGRVFAGMGIFMRTVDTTVTPKIYTETDGVLTILESLPDNTERVWLRLTLDAIKNSNQFSYSVDGINFIPVGTAFQQGSGDWKGERVGLYTYANRTVDGVALFDSFVYDTDGPVIK